MSSNQRGQVHDLAKTAEKSDAARIICVIRAVTKRLYEEAVRALRKH
jgi:hypothetical protein